MKRSMRLFGFSAMVLLLGAVSSNAKADRIFDQTYLFPSVFLNTQYAVDVPVGFLNGPMVTVAFATEFGQVPRGPVNLDTCTSTIVTTVQGFNGFEFVPVTYSGDGFFRLSAPVTALRVFMNTRPGFAQEPCRLVVQ